MEKTAEKTENLIKKEREQKILDKLIHIFAFLSFLFIGGDTLSFSLFNVHIRIAQFFLLILGLLLVLKIRFKIPIKTEYKNIRLWFLAAFVFFSFISTLASFSPTFSILFFASIIYNIVFLLFSLAIYIKLYKEKALHTFRLACYVVCWLLLLQAALWLIGNYEIPFMCNKQFHNDIYRFCLWFYEPSYFATFLTLWLGFAGIKFLIGGERDYIVDILFALISLVITTSTSGFLGIFLVFLVVYFLWLFKEVTWKKLLVLLIPVVFFVFLKLCLPNVFDTFILRLFNQSPDEASGGRISALKTAFDVFASHPFFGVGPGCYGIYLGQDSSVVPLNVTLELLSTLGIFATIGFVGYHIYLLVQAFKIYFKNKNNKDAITILALAVAFSCFLIILQINQGYLRLYHWMFLGFLAGMVRSFEQQTKSIKKQPILKNKEIETQNEEVKNKSTEQSEEIENKIAKQNKELEDKQAEKNKEQK